MIEQGTEAWHEMRKGKVTASRVADILAKTKTGVSSSRSNYLIELALQQVTGVIEPSYSNDAMAWGSSHEQSARTGFEVLHNVFVEQVAFIDHPTIKNFGCSPDGIVGDSLIEIKCPFSSAIHWGYIKNGCPSKYHIQIQTQMAVTGKSSVWFVSYDPRMPVRSQLFVQEIDRDNDFIEVLETEVITFLKEVDIEVQLMKGI